MDALLNTIVSCDKCGGMIEETIEIVPLVFGCNYTVVVL